MDDVLPNNLQQNWKSHFQMMKEIGNLQFHRAVIPEDAINLNASNWCVLPYTSDINEEMDNIRVN